MIVLPASNASFPTSITCSISTLLLSAALLIMVTAIVTLLVQKLSRWLNRSSCSQTDDLCAKSKCPTILKRDSWYRIIIFVIVLAFIFTNLFVDDKDALNYFSFASTIASIILSVVAIMMTIFSDAKNENTKAQINKAVDELNRATILIKQHTDNLTARSDEQKSTFEDILKNSQDILDRTKNIEAGVKDFNRVYSENYDASNYVEIKSSQKADGDNK